MANEKDLERAKRQVELQYESIAELVSVLHKAIQSDDDEAIEQAEQAIHADALDVQIRTGWHTPGQKADSFEYSILLCTGGPAVHIIGDLDQYGEPETAQIEYQDWFTSWINWPLTSEQEQIVLEYARQFYFTD